jgi:apoptosis-inducing factor 2
MAQTVIILGAGWAGLPLAHKLLKHTLPKAPDGLKVVLVSPNTHFYWNVAATRGVIPGAIPDEQLFLPIKTGFEKYPAEAFEFVLGKATGLSPETKTIQITGNDGAQISREYDQLVIATGSNIRSNLPFKLIGTHEETLDALHALQKQIQSAKTIVIGGAGPTGVETAGEIAAYYGSQKEVTLVNSGSHVLQAAQPLASVSGTIESSLQKLGVRLIHNTQVKDVHTNTEAKDGSKSQTQLTLSDGSTLAADLYLPLFGIQVNTGFVPSSLLDSDGNLNLEKTFRVAGTTNIWGIGDVGNIDPKQLTITDAQIIHLASALHAVVTGVEVPEYKRSEKKMIFVSMGKKHAIGQVGSWKVWGFIVAYVKGRALFVNEAKVYVDGEKLRHAAM